MRAQRAETLQDYQLVRQLRNQVRNYMTHHRSVLSEQDQVHFFEQRHSHDLVLYYSPLESFLGYTLVQARGNRFFGSLALLEEFRGKGLGTHMYQHMQQHHQESTLWLEIFSDNESSIRAAEKAQFSFHSFYDGMMTFVWGYEQER
jgi:ribosomal protein S18 acetylase RimI-like enzyme